MSKTNGPDDELSKGFDHAADEAGKFGNDAIDAFAGIFNGSNDEDD